MKEKNNFFKVIFENKNFIVINKESGISTEKNSYYQESIEEIFSKQEEFSKVPRSGIVHRLDKDTSGVLLIAKNQEYLEKLKSLFKERKIIKSYISLHQGSLKEEEGEIKFYIDKNFSKNRNFSMKKVNWDRGKNVKISFRKLYSSNNFTLIESFPETGRTHQIRFAFKQINLPIFNDNKYFLEKINEDSNFNQYLHAYFLKFSLEEENFFFVAELPENFKNKIKRLNFPFKILNE